MGHLDEDQRDNAEAIQAAVLGLFHTAMDEMRWYEFRLSRLRIDLTVRRAGFKRLNGGRYIFGSRIWQ
jgi:hypothetical protein